jgi:tripartite-type tricarboxylate transporter receptor subunit TctC/cytidylate kinase
MSKARNADRIGSRGRNNSRAEIAAKLVMTVIAMTREIGSHGIDVAAGVAGELGLKIVNSEIVASNVASGLGVQEGTVQRYLEGSASILDRWQIDKRKLSRLTTEEVLGLARQGHVLIRGWGVAALFQDVPQVLSIRVCAPMAVRERALMERVGNKDLASVRQEIERYDAVYKETMRATFDVDPENASLYHVVLNSGRFSVGDCVRMICEFAREQRFQDDLALQAAIADKLLAMRVRSTLVAQIGSEMANISVSAAHGKVVLDGMTSKGGLPARAETLANGIDGVREVESRISNMPSRGRESFYPSRPVRIIGAFAVGGAFDISARLVGQWLTEHMGQRFVIENRLGQRGYPTTEAFARVLVDAHSLLLVGSSDVISAPVYDNNEYNLARDIAPVGGIINIPYVMLVPSALSAKTVPEVVALAKTNPGALKMVSAGSGSISHALGELFKTMAVVDIVHVSRRSGTHALLDLLAEQAQVIFFGLPGSMEYIKAGKLRPLAVTTGTRLSALPDVPALAEFLPGYQATGWQGICAPRNTPAEIVNSLNKEINAALANSDIKAQLANLYASPLVGSPGDFAKLIELEMAKWGKPVKTAKPSG